MTSNNNILEIAHLEKNYQDTKGKLKRLMIFSFQVEKGKFISIVGPSGCGKKYATFYSGQA